MLLMDVGDTLLDHRLLSNVFESILLLFQEDKATIHVLTI